MLLQLVEFVVGDEQQRRAVSGIDEHNSEQADEMGISEVEEARARNEQQGWTENSQSARNYTRRHTRRKGRAIAQKLQEDLDVSGNQADRVLAWVEWDDGVRRALTLEMLADVELGFAITVHKAQGSQWRRIIIPVTDTRLLDRTLLYTALTRAQAQVILVGDIDAARRAILAPPRAHTRQVGLDLTMERLLREVEYQTSA